MALKKSRVKEKGYKSILTDRGNTIFRLIFKEFISQEEIQKKLQYDYKKNKGKRTDSQVLSNLTSNYLNAWKELNYLTISRIKNPKSKSKSHPNTNVYLAEFSPLFDWYKERNPKEPFTEKEKNYLKILLLNYNYRKLILQEYPEKNIIQATLRFYVKNCINKYLFYLRDIRENPKKYKKEIAKVEELNNPIRININSLSSKKYLKSLTKNIIARNISTQIHKNIKKNYNPSHKKTDFNIIRIIAFNEYDKDFNNPVKHLFYQYILEIGNNPELVKSTDNNILKALNLLPSI